MGTGYIQIGDFCFPVEVEGEHDNAFPLGLVNWELRDYSLLMRSSYISRSEQVRLEEAYPKSSFCLVWHLASDEPETLWLDQKQMSQRLAQIIEQEGKEVVLSQSKRDGIPPSDFSSHKRWENEPGYGPSY